MNDKAITSDRAMLLLTMLSTAPQPLLSFQKEFDCTRQTILNWVQWLRWSGFNVVLKNKCLSVPRDEWPRVELAATAFFEATHGY